MYLEELQLENYELAQRAFEDKMENWEHLSEREKEEAVEPEKPAFLIRRELEEWEEEESQVAPDIMDLLAKEG
jgi:hypothetical protein